MTTVTSMNTTTNQIPTSPAGPFYLFRTNTTGLIKSKKMKPIATYDDALSAGRALNIIDGTPDRVFVIIPVSALTCHTNITEPLEFSEAFFRLPRLSDSLNKFGQSKNQSQSAALDSDNLIDPSSLSPEYAMLYAGTQLNTIHPGLPINKESMRDKTVYQILSDAGLSKSNYLGIQSQIQFELGLSMMNPPPMTGEQMRIIEVLTMIFGSKDLINKYISELVMKRFANFGSTDSCSDYPFPTNKD